MSYLCKICGETVETKDWDDSCAKCGASFLPKPVKQPAWEHNRTVGDERSVSQTIIKCGNEGWQLAGFTCIGRGQFVAWMKRLKI